MYFQVSLVFTSVPAMLAVGPRVATGADDNQTPKIMVPASGVLGHGVGREAAVHEPDHASCPFQVST